MSRRLVDAITAVMPLLRTQDDDLHNATRSVNAVYRMPVTEAVRLRNMAAELDRRDALINELRAALRDHLATEDLKNKIADGTIQ